MSPPNIIQPIIVGVPFFKRKKLDLQDRVTRWRGIANIVELSPAGRLRLEWMIFYESCGHNAYATAKHFGIAPKTFYKWFNLFDNGKVKQLEDKSSRPKMSGLGRSLPLKSAVS